MLLLAPDAVSPDVIDADAAMEEVDEKKVADNETGKTSRCDVTRTVNVMRTHLCLKSTTNDPSFQTRALADPPVCWLATTTALFRTSRAATRARAMCQQHQVRARHVTNGSIIIISSSM